MKKERKPTGCRGTMAGGAEDATFLRVAVYLGESFMGQELRRLSEQDILEKIKRLGPQQIAEVVDFIEFLAERRHRESPLVRFLNETSGPRGGLDEVRRRLAKISGKMSDTVRELRDERG